MSTAIVIAAVAVGAYLLFAGGDDDKPLSIPKPDDGGEANDYNRSRASRLAAATCDLHGVLTDAGYAAEYPAVYKVVAPILADLLGAPDDEH